MQLALLTVPEVADRRRVSRVTVYRAVSAGRLQAVKLGTERGPLRISSEALEAYLLPARRGRGRR